MRTTNTKTAELWSRGLPLATILAICLIIVAPPVAAEELLQVEVEDGEHPVVLVRTDRHHAGQVWSFAGNRSFLGVQTVGLTPELRQHFGVPEDAGVLVAKIVEESPAAGIDLRVGDIISAVDGEEITSPAGLARAIGNHEPDDAVDLEIWRDGRTQGLEVILAEHEASWVDIRQFHLPEERLEAWRWTDEDLEGVIPLDTESLNHAIERLNEKLQGPEWQERIHAFELHRESLMERIEVLEERLRELEGELESLADSE